MKASFYLRADRLSELISFIREFTPSVRFEHNPIKGNGNYYITLDMKIEDSNKLTELQNKWYDEDNKVVEVEKKSTWVKLISKRFSFFGK